MFGYAIVISLEASWMAGMLARARIGGVVGQLADLLGRRVRQLGPAVAHVHVPQAGEASMYSRPLHVRQHRAAAAYIDHRLEVIARVMQRVDQMVLVVLDQLRLPRAASGASYELW